LFPGADSHISGRIEETGAALQAGMPPTQVIEHENLKRHYTKGSPELRQCSTTTPCM
jgi:hypothetical protein